MFKLMALTSIVTFSFLNQTQEPATEKGEALYTKINSYPSKDIDGNQSDFAAKTKGKVVLIVNVASECGYTPQYEGLQKLHEKFKDKEEKKFGSVNFSNSEDKPSRGNFRGRGRGGFD